MPTVLKSGNLNLLEPSGPVEVCNGIALPFAFTVIVLVVLFVSFRARYYGEEKEAQSIFCTWMKKILETQKCNIAKKIFNQPIDIVSVSEKQKMRKNICLMQFSYTGVNSYCEL